MRFYKENGVHRTMLSPSEYEQIMGRKAPTETSEKWRRWPEMAAVHAPDAKAVDMLHIYLCSGAGIPEQWRQHMLSLAGCVEAQTYDPDRVERLWGTVGADLQEWKEFQGGKCYDQRMRTVTTERPPEAAYLFREWASEIRSFQAVIDCQKAVVEDVYELRFKTPLLTD